MSPLSSPPQIAIIGAGPAGLMLAERLSAKGFPVDIYDRMPSVARKFLMAGRGGLNLTHSEPPKTFLTRYGATAERLRPMIEAFSPQDLRNWADGLGAETFVGSSGRVFPKALKASPLLRAWLNRLSTQGVRLHLRHDWQGFDGTALVFSHNGETRRVTPDITVLALGGASWPRLGADGGWATYLRSRGVDIAPFRPANMGFMTQWSNIFRDRFAGQPLKNIRLSFGEHSRQGELMITRDGIEGGAVYALSAALRDALETTTPVTLSLDLRPDLSLRQITDKLARVPTHQSLSNRLRKAMNLSPLPIALLRECGDLSDLPQSIKALPLKLTGTQSLERAISSAGGLRFDDLTDTLELKALPRVYAIGEMLDWEAPTGGYLLQACFSSAVHAATHISQSLSARP